MRNFLKIAEGIDVMPLLHAVQRQPELWRENDLRQTFKESPHYAADDIWLRFNDMKQYEETGKISCIGNDLEALSYPAWDKLPQAQSIVFDLMRRIEGIRLGRVVITRLAPGKTILPHSDIMGEYAHYYNRYHINLQNNPGSIFRAGNEQVYMRPGECWWFNAHADHEVINNSVDDRLTLIIDIRCIR